MSSNLGIQTVMQHWMENSNLSPNFIFSTILPKVDPVYTDFPANLHPDLIQALQAIGIHKLYSHQRTAWEHAAAGENMVITSGTASGKSLCYYLPILNELLTDPKAKALLLFPTKALAQDQLYKLLALLDYVPGNDLNCATYDGDTTIMHRRAIRDSARILISNPDMLHLGILPHHTQWEGFLSGLRFVIIDEIHTYRGVFGSHVANVIRRLNRVAAFYSSQPKYYMTSATIGNAGELAQNLTGMQPVVISEDGAGHGEKTFFIYNPPIVNEQLGIRKNALYEAVELSESLLKQDTQSIIFSQTRRSVELILSALQHTYPGYAARIRGYRSGYLPKDRREIETGLRENKVSTVVATSALELGIDIGALDASLLVGYPGTIASTTQQIGRAGRKFQESLAVLLATSDPIDQFLARNPAYFLGLSPEKALINPDNLSILLNHLKCAAFELPFIDQDSFGTLPQDTLYGVLEYLTTLGFLHHSSNLYAWMQSEYPSASISLRNATAERIDLKRLTGDTWEVFGTVDLISSYWMIHPDAIYLHEGISYRVDVLDLDNNYAQLTIVSEDYYTEPRESLSFEILSRTAEADKSGFHIGCGDLQVTNQVTGYRKIKNHSHEILGFGLVDLPAYTYDTKGFWMILHPASVEKLRLAGDWLNDPNDYGADWDSIRMSVRERDRNICQNCRRSFGAQPLHVHHIVPFRLFSSPEEANKHQNLITLCPDCHRLAEERAYVRSGLTGLAYAMRHLLPLRLMCDTRDMEVHADPLCSLFNQQPAIIGFDSAPGGIGLSDAASDIIPGWLPEVHSHIQQCPCKDGCPSCIGPAGEEGYGGKRETLAILELITHG